MHLLQQLMICSHKEITLSAIVRKWQNLKQQRQTVLNQSMMQQSGKSLQHSLAMHLRWFSTQQMLLMLTSSRHSMMLTVLMLFFQKQILNQQWFLCLLLVSARLTLVQANFKILSTQQNGMVVRMQKQLLMYALKNTYHTYFLIRIIHHL
ncbi:unknown [Firmicutes bacterium CAG:341]|nr:unknown [Firmicutes bacterium CAG:341]